MPGDQPPSPEDSTLSIENLFAEAVAAVESIASEGSEPVEVEVAPEIGAEVELEVDLPAPEPDPEASRALEKRAARRAKLKGRLTELERTRDEARAEALQLREEMIRLKATNQRLRERLDRLQAQNDNLSDARQIAEKQVGRFRDVSRRAADDLRHFQERRRQEITDQKRHGQAPAITAMLPVLDHLEMAIAHASAEPEKIVRGVEMVIAQFSGVLRRLGVKRIESEAGAPFQPELHEAMMHTPTAEVPVGHVVQQISAGYSLNGRLLRAARVSVAAAPVQNAPPPEAAENDGPPEESLSEEAAQGENLFVIPPELLEE